MSATLDEDRRRAGDRRRGARRRRCSAPLIFSDYWVNAILTQAFILGIAAASLDLPLRLRRHDLARADGAHGHRRLRRSGTWSRSAAPAARRRVSRSAGTRRSRSCSPSSLTTVIGFALRRARVAELRDLLPDAHADLCGDRVLLLRPGDASSAASRRSPASTSTRPGSSATSSTTGQRLYYIALGVALVVYVLIRYLVRTPFGISLQGIRDEPVRMARSDTTSRCTGRSPSASAASSPPSRASSSCGGTGQIVARQHRPAGDDRAARDRGDRRSGRIEGAWLGALRLHRDQQLGARQDPVGRPCRWIGGTFNTVIGAHLSRHRHRLTRWTDGDLGPPLGSRTLVGEPERPASEASVRRSGCAEQRVVKGGWIAATLRRLARQAGDRRRVQCTQRRRNGDETITGAWKLRFRLGRAARGAAIVCDHRRRRSAAPTRRAVRVAIMTDCKGAFGFALRARHRRRPDGVRAVRRRKAEEQEEAVGGHDGHQGRRQAVNIVGYGCGDDTAATALKETRRLMEQLKADVMVGPLSGDEAVAIANCAKPQPTKTFIIGTAGVAGSDAADRAEERVPLPRRRRPVERRHRRDRLQEARLAQRRDHHGRLQLRLDVRRRHHRRLLRDRRQDHEARVPAAEHDRLLVVRPPAAPAGPGGRLLLGRRRNRHRPGAEGVRAGVRPAQADAALGNLFLWFLARKARRSAADRRVRRRLRHRHRASRRTPRSRVPTVVNKWYPEASPRRRRLRLQLLPGHVGARCRA